MNAGEILLAGPYNVLYALGFGVAFLLSAWQGRRLGWPLLPWLALLAACVAGGIAGSKFLHFDFHAAAPGEKTILGGLAGGMLALLLGSRLLPISRPVSQVLAPCAMLGFAIGRVGCFLAGCCFGVPTTLPWGIQYDAGTRPFDAQRAMAVIEADVTMSLPTHPTQLYEAGLALLLALGLTRWGGRFRQPGGAAIAMAIGYGAIRFGVEFVRHGEVGDVYFGLKVVQWSVLAVLLAGITILTWRECKYATPTVGRDADPAWTPLVSATSARAAAVMVGILASTMIGWGWLTALERVVVLASTLPFAVMFLRSRTPRTAWPLTPGVAGAALLFVQLPADSFPGYPRTYYTIGAGTTTGSYNRVNDLSPNEDCGPSEFNEYSYRMFGLSIGHTRAASPRESFAARVRAFAGRHVLERVDGAPSGEEEAVQGGSVSATVYSSPFALTGGLIAGSLAKSDGDVRGGLDLMGGLRVGAPRGFFGELQYNDHEPAPDPNTRWKVSFGRVFSEEGTDVRVGAFGGGIFVGGRFVSTGGFEVEPFLGVLTEDEGQWGVMVRKRVGGGSDR